MRVPRTRKKLVGGLACVAATLTLVVASGCGGESYPEDLSYPARTDLIPLTGPTQAPFQLDSPGQWDQLWVVYESMGGKVLDAKKVEGRDVLQAELVEIFGTPAHPKVDVTKAGPQVTWKGLKGDMVSGAEKKLDKVQKSADPTDLEDQAQLALLPKEIERIKAFSDDPLGVADEDTLAEGSKLYRRNCLHCHGLTGDGRGPTGPWVNPHPRDYRRGLFKFTSVDGYVGYNPIAEKALGTNRRPLRSDLVRTMQQGIDGTSMPSFGQLPEADLEKIAGYVIHLSLRGEVELSTLRALGEAKDGKTPSEGAIRKQVRESFKEGLASWLSSQACGILVNYPFADSDTPLTSQGQDSIAKGFRLFGKSTQTWEEPAETGAARTVRRTGAGCIECHTDYGRQFNYKWDDWGGVVRPTDLTAGIYRGGRKPVDLFYRLHSGVAGTPMPQVLGSKMTTTDVWHLVHFVQALPYPGMLPEDIQKQIYPDFKK